MGELRIERRFRASPERVFAFVTDPANVAQWWGPEGMAIEPGYALDLGRPGPWTFTVNHPRGTTRMHGEVLAVDPPRAVELTMNIPGMESETMSTVRLEIAPDGAGGTRFTLIQSGITDEMVAMGRRGWVGPLDRLERLAGGAA